MKLNLLLLQFIGLSFFCNAQQVVNIPDPNFKAALIAYPGIDTNQDGKVQVTEAAAFTGYIDARNFNITDATGIEAFVNLLYLNISFNQLTHIDLSSNVNLLFVLVQNNNLTSINLSNLNNLENLFLDNNQLTSLDISDLYNLEHLYVTNNQLTTLDVSTNSQLIYLDTYNNSDLNCIQIGSVFTSSIINSWSKDTHTSYSEVCETIISGGGHTTVSFRLYPNPVMHSLNIESDIEIAQVEIYSIQGEKEIETRWTSVIDVRNLKKGIYFINVTDVKGDVTNQKFIKE